MLSLDLDGLNFRLIVLLRHYVRIHEGPAGHQYVLKNQAVFNDFLEFFLFSVPSFLVLGFLLLHATAVLQVTAHLELFIIDVPFLILMTVKFAKISENNLGSWRMTLGSPVRIS